MRCGSRPNGIASIGAAVNFLGCRRRQEGRLPALTTRLVSLLVLALTCGGAWAATGLHRGTYVEIDGAGFFQACGSSRQTRVEGASAAAELSAIYAAVAGKQSGNARGSLYVELRARPGPRGSLQVNGLERATKDSAGCSEVLRKSLFKAFGAEPGWHLFIDDTGLRWRTLSDGVLMSFPYRRYRRSDDAWVFDSATAKNSIHVELRRVRCIEPVSGSRYSFEAKVAIGEKHYAGCAYPGSQFR
jgi:uncharacterized membrane protein